MSQQITHRAKDAVMRGGEPVEVTHLDGSRETVMVRLLPVRMLPDYQAAIEDEAACVDLFAGRDKGWADTLTADSFEAVLQAGEALNLDPLARYCARARARREKILPGLESLLLREVAARATVATSPKSSPT